MKRNAVVLIYGFGGHNEQMRRVYEGIKNKVSKEEVLISIYDERAKNILTEVSYKVIPPFKPIKHSYLKGILNTPKFTFTLIKTLFDIKRKYNVKFVISTGPSIGLFYGFFLKFLFRAKFLFIETWSRFYTKSRTGKIAYFFSDYFYVQNKNLSKLYPKSIYCGRL